jgi:hypothetical protein
LARLAASAQQGNEPANQQIPAQQSILANVLATMWEAALPLDADKLQARFKALRDIADAEMEINKARTQALTARVFKNPTYLHQGRLVIGAGFAAVQNVATLPDRSNVIGVGFPELWYQRGSLAMGQAPNILDVSGFVTRPWAYRDYGDRATQKYLASEDFGRSIGQTQKAMEFCVAQGWASKIECWDDLPPDRRADWAAPALKYRLTLKDEGKATKVYCESIDIVSGPGPGRELASQDIVKPDGTIVPKQIDQTDADKLKQDDKNKKREYQVYTTGNDYASVAKGGTVVVYGCSPSGAWAAQFARHAGAAKIYWVGDPHHMPTRKPTAQDKGKRGTGMNVNWSDELIALYEKLGPGEAWWIGTYIGDRNIEIIKAMPRGSARFEAAIANVKPRPETTPAPGGPAPAATAEGPAGPPALDIQFSGAPGAVAAHQLVVCTGANMEAENGLADTAQNVSDEPKTDGQIEAGPFAGQDKPNTKRFAYIPIFAQIPKAAIIAANEGQGGWWKVYDNPIDTGLLLGFEDKHSGIRILGAAAYNMFKLFPKAEADVIFKIQDHYAKQLPAELQTPDGIGLHGQTIQNANQLLPGAEPRTPIQPGTKPKDNKELINLNTAFAMDLERVPSFGVTVSGDAQRKFNGFQGTVAELIISVRSGKQGIVIHEIDPHENTPRNKVDGFRGVHELWQYGLLDQSDVVPYLAWLRV